MLYYRMTNKHDCYYPHKNITIVYNELKTGKELEKLNICKDSACFEKIYTSRKNTYFVFGCRFVRDENKVFQDAFASESQPEKRSKENGLRN